MAGLSSRFAKAGYEKPKYMLDIAGDSVFFCAVNGFCKYFNSCQFIFVCRNICNTRDFIQNECNKMGLDFYRIVELESMTLGQAHTVALGLQKAGILHNERLLIFNIDTFRPNFELPKTLDFDYIDGYLEVFEAEGEQWSFVLPQNNNKKATEGRVVKTAEKERISSLCSSGLYYFSNVGDFMRIFKAMLENGSDTKGEYYIAPMYNYLINEGKEICYFKISLDEIVFCGTPQEYETLQNKEKR